MNVTERRVVASVAASLSADNESCSEEIQAFLRDPSVRVWLDTWVKAPLDLIAREDRTRDDLELAGRLAR